MSYFGGYGGGRGWLKVHFLLTSAELDALLPATTHFCWTSSAVTLRYRPPTRAEYLADYRRFLRAARSGAPLKEDTADNLTHSLSATAKALHRRRTRDGRALRFDEREPVITAGFATLIDINSKLYSERSRTGSAVGLQWSYPKVVSWEQSDWKDASTEDLPNRRFFDARVAWIRAHTRPVAITWKGVRRRTSLRVSPEMREWLAAHPYLRRNRMTLGR
jgi:hypothetical protein